MRDRVFPRDVEITLVIESMRRTLVSIDDVRNFGGVSVCIIVREDEP